jgi:hypothetical protein
MEALMGLLRKLTVIASGAVTVAAIGVVYSGAASANTTPTPLCVTESNGVTVICAYATSGGLVGSTSNDSDWYYPTPGQRTIRTGNVCMQIATGTTAYLIDLKGCSGTVKAQQFTEVAGNTFENALTDDCLAYDASTGGFHMAQCNGMWYEEFQFYD